MEQITFSYDELSDTMYILFGENHPATGIELNEDVLLRVDLDKKKLIGLSIFDYSKVSEQNQIELVGLNKIPGESVPFVIQLLKSKPLNQFLKMINQQTVKLSKVVIEPKIKEINIDHILVAE